jgi:hypothetical protein
MINFLDIWIDELDTEIGLLKNKLKTLEDEQKVLEELQDIVKEKDMTIGEYLLDDNTQKAMREWKNILTNIERNQPRQQDI